MTLIGMLHHRADPEKVRRAYMYSAVAKAEGVEFFYFTPGKVNIDKQTIKGKFYENGGWFEKDFPFPDAIYNASYPVSEKAERIIDFLYDRIPFTSHSVGNKWSVYNRIKQGKDFAQYLIPTEEITEVKKITDMAERFPKIIMKPLSGHQGADIIFIEMHGNGKYKMNESDQISTYKKGELLDLMSDRIQQQQYLVQPFMSFQIKSGQVYDFRLHVQKNGDGKWTVTSIYPRIGTAGGITSNMGSGGYTAFLEVFLKREFDDSWYDIKRTLEQFSVKFAKHFESLYDNVSFDEYGIDVGIDEHQKLWIIEVNWRPGPPVIFNCELDVAKNTIHYAKFLAGNKKKKF